jgi:Family of unknown function (DUF5302)
MANAEELPETVSETETGKAAFLAALEKKKQKQTDSRPSGSSTGKAAVTKGGAAGSRRLYQRRSGSS